MIEKLNDSTPPPFVPPLAITYLTWKRGIRKVVVPPANPGAVPPLLMMVTPVPADSPVKIKCARNYHG